MRQSKSRQFCAHFCLRPKPHLTPKILIQTGFTLCLLTKLSNKTHRSSVDPDALLCRKSKAHPALHSYRSHVLMDNRHALIVDCKVTQATGTGERDAARPWRRIIPV